MRTDVDDNSPMAEKTVPIYKAIEMVSEQLVACIKLRATNPIYNAIWKHTNVSVSFTSYERKCDENCARLRAFVHKYLDERKKDQRKS